MSKILDILGVTKTISYAASCLTVDEFNRFFKDEKQKDYLEVKTIRDNSFMSICHICGGATTNNYIRSDDIYFFCTATCRAEFLHFINRYSTGSNLQKVINFSFAPEFYIYCFLFLFGFSSLYFNYISAIINLINK